MPTNYKRINITAEKLEQRTQQVGDLTQLKTSKKQDLVEAINDVVSTGNEVVYISLVQIDGTIPFNEEKITLTVDGLDKLIDVNANGQATCFVTIGKNYRITYPSYLGYKTPDSETFTSSQANRFIVRNYPISAELDDVAASVVLEESSNPQWTLGGKMSAVDQILNADGSWILDPVHKKRAKLSSTNGMMFSDGTPWTGTYGNSFRHIIGCKGTTTTNSNGKKVLHISTRGIGSMEFYDMWAATYKGNVHDGKLWSQPNVAATGSNSIDQFFAYAQAQGRDYGLVDYHDQRYFVALHLVKFGTPDVLGNMGVGLQDAGSAYYNATTGATVALGDGTGEMNYGDTVYKQNKLFGIEALTGQQWEFRPCIFAKDGYFIIYKGNKCSSIITPDDPEYMRTVEQISGSGSYIGTMVLGDDFDILPKTTGGSSSSDWTDGFWATTSDTRVVLFGGASHRGSLAGLGASFSTDVWSNAVASCGARLAFRGNISEYEIVSGSELAELNS